MLNTDSHQHSTVRQLLSRLEERQNELKLLDSYYDGEQALAFLSPEVRDALKDRIKKLNVNIPRIVVTSLSERMRIVGLQKSGVPDPWLWNVWNQQDMDEKSASVHREALALGRAFVIVWADSAGNPTVSVVSARQMYAVEDPNTGQIMGAVKRWTRPDVERPELSVDVAMLYLPTRIYRFESNPGTAPEAGAWEVKAEIDNPLGVVPVVSFKNSDRMVDEHGVSEMRDVLPITDGLTKLLSDLMVGSEHYARPRRWGSGIELPEKIDEETGEPTGEVVAPFGLDGDLPWIAENEASRFGSFAASDLGGYETAVRVLQGQIMAVSTLPAHYIGVMSNAPVSADSIRASEASLTARAHARMRTFGRAWEQVLRMIYDAAERPLGDAENVSPTWADPSTRTIAQEADAAAKIHDSLGSVPVPLLERLGFDPSALTTLKSIRTKNEEESTA